MSIFKKRDRRRDRSELPVAALKKLLEHTARENGFKAAMMATENGFISVNIDSHLDAEQLSAIARIVWKFVSIVRDRDFLGDIQDVMMSGVTGDEGLLCHSFMIQKRMAVLMFQTPFETTHQDVILKAEQGIERIISEALVV